MKEPWKRNAKAFLALLITAAVVYCLFPAVKTASSRLAARFYPERALTVTVFSLGEGGGSEMWLTAPAGSPLLKELEKLPANAGYSGACEYRKAADYGYDCDFLVSYGENVGSVFALSYVPAADSKLEIWCSPAGGVVEVKDGDKDPIYRSSYSETGRFETVELQHNPLNAVLTCLFTLLAWCACMCLLYMYISGIAERGGAPSPAAGVKTADSASIGLARTTAAFLVVYVHSFLTSTGSVSYYNTPMSGALMGAASVLRWLAFCCVPLFMVLTGFLSAHRTSFKDNIKRLIPMLGSFLIVCGLHLLMRRFYWNIPVSPKYVLSTIFGMDLAWYFEMYLGLALLQPFLNILWLKLDQEQRGTLICVLLALTALGSVTGGLLPTWWITLYPLTYYFIGAWLREYPVYIRRSHLLAALLGMLSLEALRSFLDANGGKYPWEPLGGSINVYYSVPVVLSTVLLFLLLKETPVRPRVLQQFFMKAGRHTLTTYLLSVSVMDSLFWTAVRPKFPTYQQFFPAQIPLTAVLYLVTLAVAVVIDTAVQLMWGKLQKRLEAPITK